MADGSVIIEAALDTEQFTAQIGTLETELSALSSRLQAGVQTAVASAGVDAGMLLVISAVISAMETMTARVYEQSASAAHGAVLAFSSADWQGAGGNGASGITSGFTERIASLTHIAQATADRVRNLFSGGWVSVGASISEGIASGIMASAGAIIAAVRSVSAQTLAETKKVYEISSPSKLMKDEVGVMLSRGIAEGILDGSRYIEEALAGVGQRSVLTDNTGSGAGTGGQVVQHIYLRENDTSPYATARAIRRESEALLRI
ncbi:MAG: hypothetical protein E7658_01630 [Ruminococcaceae bacterium]|nr:hypothetical protein [Oscillospiraceae bacterium]